jgi:hypothetical protein
MPGAHTVDEETFTRLTRDFTEVGTAADAERFARVAERRLTERPMAVTGSGNDREVTLLGDGEGVWITDCPTEELFLVYLNESVPNARLKLLNGRLFYLDDSSPQRDWRWLLALAEWLPVALPEHVPFGYVEDGVIRAIIYTVEVASAPGSVDELGYPTCLYSAFEVFVLEGTDRPEVLAYRGDPVAFVDGLWRAVGDGTLERLSGRFESRLRGIKCVWDGRNARLRIRWPGRGQPRLGSNYIEWYPVEETPGANPRPDYGPPVTRGMRNFFNP